MSRRPWTLRWILLPWISRLYSRSSAHRAPFPLSLETQQDLCNITSEWKVVRTIKRQSRMVQTSRPELSAMAAEGAR